VLSFFAKHAVPQHGIQLAIAQMIGVADEQAQCRERVDQARQWCERAAVPSKDDGAISRRDSSRAARFASRSGCWQYGCATALRNIREMIAKVAGRPARLVSSHELG
jgi:hypothetical protein